MKIRSILAAGLLAITPVALVSSPAEAVLYSGSKKVCGGQISFTIGTTSYTKNICSTVFFNITDTKKFFVKKNQVCIDGTGGLTLDPVYNSYRGMHDISTHWRDVVSGDNFHAHANGWTDKWCWVDGQNDSVNVHQATSKSGYIRVVNKGVAAKKGAWNDVSFEHTLTMRVDDYL